MKHWTTKNLAYGGIIAALYVVLTLALQPLSLGYNGQIEFRVSEALTLLPVLMPVAVPGLFVGCLLANLLCGASLVDIVLGSIATLLAAYCTYRLRKNIWLAAAMPVVFNGIIIGVMLSVMFSIPLLWSIFTIAAGELVACYALGIPLIKGLQKLNIIK